MSASLRQGVGAADIIADVESSRNKVVTRVMKIILAFFLVQKINWGSGPMSKRALYLGHRALYPWA